MWHLVVSVAFVILVHCKVFWLMLRMVIKNSENFHRSKHPFHFQQFFSSSATDCGSMSPITDFSWVGNLYRERALRFQVRRQHSRWNWSNCPAVRVKRFNCIFWRLSNFRREVTENCRNPCIFLCAGWYRPHPVGRKSILNKYGGRPNDPKWCNG